MVVHVYRRDKRSCLPDERIDSDAETEKPSILGRLPYPTAPAHSSPITAVNNDVRFNGTRLNRLGHRAGQTFHDTTHLRIPLVIFFLSHLFQLGKTPSPGTSNFD